MHPYLADFGMFACIFIYHMSDPIVLKFFNAYHIWLAHIIVNTPLGKTGPSRRRCLLVHFRCDMLPQSFGTDNDHCRQKLPPYISVPHFWSSVSTPETANTRFYIPIHHWNGNVAILAKCSSQWQLAASDKNCVEITFPFRWLYEIIPTRLLNVIMSQTVIQLSILIEEYMTIKCKGLTILTEANFSNLIIALSQFLVKYLYIKHPIIYAHNLRILRYVMVW